MEIPIGNAQMEILKVSGRTHLSSVQNPSIIPFYWLVYRDSPIGLLQYMIIPHVLILFDYHRILQNIIVYYSILYRNI